MPRSTPSSQSPLAGLLSVPILQSMDLEATGGKHVKPDTPGLQMGCAGSRRHELCSVLAESVQPELLTRHFSENYRILTCEKTAGLFFFTVNITTNKMTERGRDILGFKGLQRLCPSISLVLWNQKHLLTFLCLSLTLVTSTSLWRKGQLSVSMVYILPSHNGHLYIFKFYPKDEMFYFQVILCLF